MFELKNAIVKWKKSLRKNEALEEGYIAELESHLRDEITALMNKGMNEEEAFSSAVQKIGKTDIIGEEYYKTDTTHFVKRPPWKENRFMPSLLSNYFKVARRNIFRNKGYSFINITGLALGMACCLLIALWALDEMSFDSFHTNADNIYGIVQTQYSDNEEHYVTSTPAVLARSLKDEFPEITAAARYTAGWDEMTVSYNDNLFFERALAYADPSFLQMFSFPFLKGDKNTALSSPNSIIITEEMALKYFGSEDPIGKSLLINNKASFEVTGVMKNIPDNTIFNFSALIPFQTFLQTSRKPEDNESWESNFTDTFVQLNGNASVNEFSSKLHKYIKTKIFDNPAPEFTPLPLKKSRFSSWYQGEKRISSITIFSSIAFIILLIACINFINLSIVSSVKRSREIGLRKVLGANRSNTAIQFLGEFLVLTIIAFLIAIILVILFMPLFNDVFGRELKLDILFRKTTILASLGIILFTGIIGGGYPAIILSSLKPASILKNNSGKNLRKSSLRRFFVVFQFSLSTVMIIVMSVIYMQYDFIRYQDPGFNKEQILYVPLKSNTNLNYNAVKNALSSVPGITSMTGTTNLPSMINRSTSSNITWEGKSRDNKTLIYFANIDFNYAKTLGIGLKNGVDITERMQNTEPVNAALINEEMARLIGIINPIGAELTVQGKKLKITGILNSFHFVDYTQNIPPVVFSLISDQASLSMPNYLIAKISQGNISSTINLIHSKWKEINPLVPFEYHFIDEDFDKMYKQEEKLAGVIGIFTFMAIIISALGLFGLSSYTAEQRKKEIAVRKVLGSRITDILKLLITEYFYLILTANILAWPLGYYIAHKWLQDYAYKISINPGIFILAGISALIIMAAAVGYQSVKAATANPADNLRSE